MYDSLSSATCTSQGTKSKNSKRSMKSKRSMFLNAGYPCIHHRISLHASCSSLFGVAVKGFKEASKRVTFISENKSLLKSLDIHRVLGSCGFSKK